MNGIVLDEDPRTPRALNDLARHKMINRIEADILADMQVCEIEGWDKTEYIRMLYEMLNHFMERIGEQTCIQEH